jgi:phosphoribosyl 1,2-cyclic phosphodiesterase
LPDSDDFFVKFWGVRGSIACPGPAYARYGGNTSCLEVRCGASLFIMDGGTGLRALGESMRNELVDADLYFTHSHFDHIAGLPFFKALFKPENRLRLWAGHLLPESTLQEVIGTMMKAPLFPVPKDVFTAAVSYHDFRAGEVLTPKPGVTINTAPLNHPNNATGYRINYRERSIRIRSTNRARSTTTSSTSAAAPTSSFTIAPTQRTSIRSIPGGDIRPGRRARGWPMPRA